MLSFFLKQSRLVPFPHPWEIGGDCLFTKKIPGYRKKNNYGRLPSQMIGEVNVQGCTAILRENLARRDKK